MGEKDLKKLKLLVVDDESENLDLLYRTFWRDFKVYRANNAYEALEVLDKEGEMAIIISDQRMPEMNGTELLGLIVNRFPDTIRILLTGFTDVEDLVDAINSGQVFKYITKPWNPENLKALVRQASDTYILIKERTQELRRALRRESSFNAVTSAIRESLDYESMLQKIVATIGQTFAATTCILRPVEDDLLIPVQFSYYDPQFDPSSVIFDSSSLIAEVLENRYYQLTHETCNDISCHYLVVPLIYQQHLLAVMSISQCQDQHSWEEEDIQLITGLAEQAALAVSQAKLYQSLQEKQQQLRAELEVARQIQNNLLRQTLPDIEGVNVQACCYPAQEVGGDFFEVFVHPKDHLWIAVGDVSGKGVPAALFMASAISLLRRELAQDLPDEPNVIMQNLNRALWDDLEGNNCFITLVIACYMPSTRKLTYANAGHIYPLFWSGQPTSENQPHYLKVRSVPLGILPQWQGQLGQSILAPGDTLLLTSDGITESKVSHFSNNSVNSEGGTQQSKRTMLNQDGLWQILLEQPQPLSLQHLLARIQANNDVQEDDQTILSLEVL
ncbi:SpoIIE family protein phosphatase [Cronbergia sp. UHCC 0137]|uniref:SpoIIE family protein phosphatase n=1 Tax=Cronbergia sp. UHCC 0137 TaxID=3110239 RepID=UPI002B1F52BE|nr:SpoIIE family protein phosphatase [Cronbergia sp. UHCC 0137]MEA5619222.1 SpoIIE family protein phosphatase [Cronbergia sp. UHCC 0137]